MAVWLISANSKTYDHKAAFEKRGYDDWRQLASYDVGDIVYIYVTDPERKIRYKTKVEKVDMTYSECVDDSEYWITPNNGGEKFKYVRLRLLTKADTSLLSLDLLRDHGLKNAPQRAMKLESELLAYIETVFQTEEQHNTDNINEPMIPKKVLSVSDNIHYVCGRCNTEFIKAERCPECGQLVKNKGWKR